MDVQISLDRIGTRITWQVGNDEELRELRSALRRGDFGRAHLIEDNDQRERLAA
ncbi:MAG TPA: hypothetical protein VF157_15475 [Chloroflexota bacterium]